MTTSEDTRPHAAPRPLGTLLVERGLLTPAQLHDALVEQGRTGTPLGQVVVRLGYVSPGAVAQALATQRGGIAKTEFGMAVGFDTRISGDGGALPPVTTAENGRSVGELQALLAAAEARLDAMAAEMAEAARRLVAAELDRDRLQRENERLTAVERRCA